MPPFFPHLKWKAEYTGDNMVMNPTQQIQSDIHHPPCLTFLKTKWRKRKKNKTCHHIFKAELSTCHPIPCFSL